MLSVVIPMFNAGGFIDEQLAALAAQEYRCAWEVLVVDNRSTDDSLARVRLWKHRLPMRILEAYDRQGVSYTRNVGSHAAGGDFLLYLDADDVVAPGWLAAMARGAAHSDFTCSQQEPFAVRAGRVHTFPRRGNFSAEGFLPWSYGGTLGIRKEVFMEAGGFQEDWHFAEDVEFCWRVQLEGIPLGYVPDAIVRYREPASLTALARQRFVFGMHTPRLYLEFRSAGLPRRRPRSVAADYLWIGTRLPYLGLSSYRRRLWVGQTALSVGRLVGAWRWRSAYL